jgi:predicted dehydrogenase/threonine dehydrogenase-like Zn-dependent dehydrogenase
LQKIRTDGLIPTLETVFARLDEPMPLGYCNVGRVIEVGADVPGYAVGDRAASNGPHAEMVCVPWTLAAKVPDGVADEVASFTVLGAVALQGVRLAQPTFGETFGVVGLGLLGLMAVQFLRASGCRVLGTDVNQARCDLARQFGCEAVNTAAGADPVRAAEAYTAGRGLDGVMITASAKTDEIMHQAAKMCRKRGRIVLVGVVGLNLQRADFYEKELTFQVSCSYGPGRYDSDYEGGNDYPLGFVRWTAARNFEAILDGLRSGILDLRPLVTHRFEHGQAAQAYDAVVNDGSVLGAVLRYPTDVAPTTRTVAVPAAKSAPATAQPGVAVIGAGNFAKLYLLPSIKATGVPIVAIASAGGASARHAAQRFGAREATTDARALLARPEISTVFIATRHNAHAGMVVEALDAGKHTYVEKPIALNLVELARVRAAQRAHPQQQLMVGFNRRFAPHSVALHKLLAARSQPVALSYLVNAGEIPAEHWAQDAAVGGGRIIGEGCHFIDLLRFLVGHPITRVQAVMFGAGGKVCDDKMSINLTFADGSIGTVQYWANGPKDFPKERVEVFSEGRVAVLENFRRLRGFSWCGLPAMRMSQNKGFKEEAAAFIERVRSGGPLLIPWPELEEVSLATFAAMRSAQDGAGIALSTLAAELDAAGG